MGQVVKQSKNKNPIKKQKIIEVFLKIMSEINKLLTSSH